MLVSLFFWVFYIFSGRFIVCTPPLIVPEFREDHPYVKEVRVVHFPDEDCFTEGTLFIHEKEQLVVSCGMYKQSYIFIYDLVSDKIVKRLNFNSVDELWDVFAEGICRIDDEIFMLTYKSKKVLKFDLNLNYINSQSFITDNRDIHISEGWGLTFDKTRNKVYATDGTRANGILVLDILTKPSTFQSDLVGEKVLVVKNNYAVYCDYELNDIIFNLKNKSDKCNHPKSLCYQRIKAIKPIKNLNELEYLEGPDLIAANIWQTREIIFIHPPGKEPFSFLRCENKVILDLLTNELQVTEKTKYGLNGIAYLPSKNLLYLTRKYSPVAVEVVFENLTKYLTEPLKPMLLPAQNNNELSSIHDVNVPFHPNSGILPFTARNMNNDKNQFYDKRNEKFLLEKQYISPNFSFLKSLSFIFGWLYVISWMISFYPQIFLNYMRKSTTGMSVDLTLYNIIGFFAYLLYTTVQFCAQALHNAPVVVYIQDIVFAAHSLIVGIILMLQILIYSDGRKKPGTVFKALAAILILLFTIHCLAAFVHIIPWTSVYHDESTKITTKKLVSEKFSTQPHGIFYSIWNSIFIVGQSWSVMMFLGFLKVFITVIKYNPQVHLNFVQASTEGLSGMQFVLDFLGAVLSILQNVIDAIRFNSPVYIYGNLPKLGISTVTIFYDTIILFQHYVLYKQKVQRYEPVREARRPSLYVGTNKNNGSSLNLGRELQLTKNIMVFRGQKESNLNYERSPKGSTSENSKSSEELFSDHSESNQQAYGRVVSHSVHKVLRAPRMNTLDSASNHEA